MKDKKSYILKVLVGSRGYGVYDGDSDYDYRGVYVLPTEKILSLGHKYKGSHWVEGCGEDDTAYEIGHFLHLCLQCNPTIIHTLKAPTDCSKCYVHPKWGKELIKLWPHILDFKRIYDAFTGYSVNQRKKMVDNKDNKWNKYGTAYIRQLLYLYDIVRYGDYNFVLSGYNNMLIRSIRNGDYTPGEILDLAGEYKEFIDGWIKDESLFENPPFVQDRDKINKFLLKIRKEFWK